MNDAYERAQACYDAQIPEDQDLELTTWTCCGGIELQKDEKCSVCGESYE